MTGNFTVDRNLTSEGNLPVNGYISPDLTFSAVDKNLRLINAQNGEFRIKQTAGDKLSFAHYNGVTTDTWLELDLNNASLDAKNRRIGKVYTIGTPTMALNKQFCDSKIVERIYTPMFAALSKQRMSGMISFNASTGTILNSLGCCSAITQVSSGSLKYFVVTNLGVPSGTSMCCVATNSMGLMPSETYLTAYTGTNGIKYVMSCFQQANSSNVIITIYQVQKQLAGYPNYDVESAWMQLPVFPNVEITMAIYY
jgi:hypothetical protein